MAPAHGFTSPDELKRARQAVGWSQKELARRAGFTRPAVAYHENKRAGRIDGVAPAMLRKVLIAAGAVLKPVRTKVAPLAYSPEMILLAAPGPSVPICGAKTRTGAPCKAKAIPGKRRCRNHGGLSTGPRTPEGKAAIAAAARARANLKGAK